MQRILVIDDDPQVLGFICELLTRNGYKVFEAVHGRHGVKMLESNSVDLVITDLLMPEQEGVETIMEVRKHWPEIKIIAMSGGSWESHDFLPIAERLGAKRTLKKHMTSEQLLSAVSEVLDGTTK